jgi:hypothetical protein
VSIIKKASLRFTLFGSRLIFWSDGWPKKLQAMLPTDRPLLDSVVDSAGGNITTLLLRFLKHGAKVAVYGQ